MGVYLTGVHLASRSPILQTVINLSRSELQNTVVPIARCSGCKAGPLLRALFLLPPVVGHWDTCANIDATFRRRAGLALQLTTKDTSNSWTMRCRVATRD